MRGRSEDGSVFRVFRHFLSNSCVAGWGHFGRCLLHDWRIRSRWDGNDVVLVFRSTLSQRGIRVVPSRGFTTVAPIISLIALSRIVVVLIMGSTVIVVTGILIVVTMVFMVSWVVAILETSMVAGVFLLVMMRDALLVLADVGRLARIGDELAKHVFQFNR